MRGDLLSNMLAVLVLDGHVVLLLAEANVHDGATGSDRLHVSFRGPDSPFHPKISNCMVGSFYPLTEIFLVAFWLSLR